MGGPIADIAAITSLFSFWIIAPNPELFKFEKIAASKFNLKIDAGGGCPAITLIFIYLE